MINHNHSLQNPYAVNRPAGRTFVGYREGRESVQEVCNCLIASAAGSPSYWIAGEPKSGKSSFLLKLEDSLGKDAGEEATRFRPVPLAISCADYASPLALCRGVVRCLAESVRSHLRIAEPEAAGEPQLAPFQLLESDGPASIQRMLPLLWQDLAAGARQLYGGRSRFVLLIDDLDAAVEGRWAQKLFPTLRLLLTEGPGACSRCGLSGDNVKLVLAGSPDLAAAPLFGRLSSFLHEIRLRPLALNDVKELIRTAWRPLNGNQGDLAVQIMRAAGGQPWLTQLVLEQFTRAKRLEREFAEWFKAFDWTGLSGETEPRPVLERWLGRLPEAGPTILAHLVLAQDGMTPQEIGDATGLDEKDLSAPLGRLRDLGLVYESIFRPGACEVCEVVKRWYLGKSGGSVFVGEIERLKTPVPAAPQPAARDFSLLLSLDHRVMVADGLYTRFFSLNSGFTDEARRLYRDARDAASLRNLDDLRARLGNLGKNFVDEDWRVAWEDYFERTDRQRIRFILQTGDLDLLDFPIELLPFEQGFLGLRVPTFKEVLGLRRKEPYRLAGGCLPAREPVNVLLVGAGGGGQYANRSLSALPQVVPEIIGVCKALRMAATRRSFSLGRIVVLSDAPGLAIEGAVVRPATVDGLREALGVEPQSGFHILHYSGHYKFGTSDHETGLLIPGRTGLELFSLPALFQLLDGDTVRFACFNGCSSGDHQPATPTHYLGAPYTCLRAGVPAVVGMRWPIGDRDARDLAIVFYEQLASLGVPELALLETRMWAEREHRGTLWAAPVMLTC
jgi:hypothetical protein